MASKNEITFEILEELDTIKHWDTLPDCKIITEDDGELDAHKIVLAKASPMMRAHFYGEMKSGGIDQIKSDFNTAIMTKIRYYAYHYKLDLDSIRYPFKSRDECIYQVFAAANFYLMRKLEAKCCSLLLDDLNIRNILPRMNFAASYNLIALYDICFKELCSTPKCDSECTTLFQCTITTHFGQVSYAAPDELAKQFRDLTYETIFDISEKFCIYYNSNSKQLYSVLTFILYNLAKKCERDSKDPLELREKYDFFKYMKIHYLNNKQIKDLLVFHDVFFTANERSCYNDLHDILYLQ